MCSSDLLNYPGLPTLSLALVLINRGGRKEGRKEERGEREQERKFTLLESNEVITTNFTETKITIKEYYERLYANKLDK